MFCLLWHSKQVSPGRMRPFLGSLPSFLRHSQSPGEGNQITVSPFSVSLWIELNMIFRPSVVTEIHLSVLKYPLAFLARFLYRYFFQYPQRG